MQTRTPSHIKWLLNERAALAGEAREFEKRIHELQQKLSAVTEKIAALDLVMAQYDARLRPDAAGIVRATGQKYGGWGGQRQCLLELLEKAAPASIDAKALALRVAAHYDIQIETPGEFRKHLDHIRRTLNTLKAQGLIEPCSAIATCGAPRHWRKKGVSSAWERLLAETQVPPNSIAWKE